MPPSNHLKIDSLVAKIHIRVNQLNERFGYPIHAWLGFGESGRFESRYQHH